MTAELAVGQSALAIHFGGEGRDVSGSVTPQGGDPRARPNSVRLDLSTCVCRYGPAPAALECFGEMGAQTLWAHPYGAAERLAGAYGIYLGVDPDELVVARGISELIWLLARSELGPRVVVPVPAYTEYHQAFPATRDTSSNSGGFNHALAEIEASLAAAGVVLLSNPHNPSGRAFSRSDLEALARTYPEAMLIVDESYVEFCADPAMYSLIGTDCDNVIVFRSPSKFFGIAGVRVGVAWSRHGNLGAWFGQPRGSWPISAVEADVAIAALKDSAWITANRRSVLADGLWLDRHLRHLGQVIDGSVTHFRLVVNPEAERVSRHLAKVGLGVRLLSRAHGLAESAIRVAAPRLEERAQAAALLASVVG